MANLLLSIVFVKPFGMVGVAWGTVIPVAFLAAFCIFPRACRVVEMSVARGYREVVWPAAWPAFVVVTLMMATRHAVPQTLIAILADLALGGLLYLAIFFLLALPRDEREWLTTAINQITGLWAPGFGRGPGNPKPGGCTRGGLSPSRRP